MVGLAPVEAWYSAVDRWVGALWQSRPRGSTLGYPEKIKVKILKLVTFFFYCKIEFWSQFVCLHFFIWGHNLVHRHLKFLAFLHSENEVKICKIDKMAKNHFSRAEKGSQGVWLGVLGVVWISKSGLGILIRAPEMPFLVTQKRQKWADLADLAVLGVPKMALQVPE